METLYRVIWDEKYNNNCHDEILTDWISHGDAQKFVDEWVLRRINSIGIPLSEENVSALSKQLSFETKDIDFKVELSERVISKFQESLSHFLKTSQESLDNGWGKAEYIEKCMKESREVLDMFRYAKNMGLKARIVFEKY